MDKPSPIVDLHPQLLRDAFDVLDRYSASIAKRDVVKSLDENRRELLRRVRAALEPLISKGNPRRDDVAQIAQRIDDVLAAESTGAPGNKLLHPDSRPGGVPQFTEFLGVPPTVPRRAS